MTDCGEAENHPQEEKIGHVRESDEEYDEEDCEDDEEYEFEDDEKVADELCVRLQRFEFERFQWDKPPKLKGRSKKKRTKKNSLKHALSKLNENSESPDDSFIVSF